MTVKLLTPPAHIRGMEYNAAYAMLTCHANTNRLEDETPCSFIKKVIKAGHDSILEHITLTYEVKELSRACLQELARHRHISLSVESTRHTIKEKLKTRDVDIVLPYNNNTEYKLERIIWDYFDNLSYYVDNNPEVTNDVLKYAVPECLATNLVMTANIRELRHIVKLRTAPAALREFQLLAREFVEVLPDEFKYLLEDCVYHDE